MVEEGCMKRILMGTTALCAVAAFGSGPALADGNEPLKLTTGGFFHAAYGDIVSENGLGSVNRRRDDIGLDNIVRFDGLTKLDNGITVGVSVQMRGVGSGNSGTPGDQIKRDYAFFRGDFGEFRVGDDDD